VVYKVDRLTRSLSDFAKIIEAFDAKGVSFVSSPQEQCLRTFVRVSELSIKKNGFRSHCPIIARFFMAEY